MTAGAALAVAAVPLAAASVAAPAVLVLPLAAAALVVLAALVGPVDPAAPVGATVQAPTGRAAQALASAAARPP
jgi:hypothetical protein